MKTKDLIERLKECDLLGEQEVCVNNIAITSVGREPAYWDGNLQVIEINENDDYVSARIQNTGDKIVISTTSILDLASYHPNVPIDLSALDQRSQDWWNQSIAVVQSRHRDINYQIELEDFTSYILDQLSVLGWAGDVLNAKRSIKIFFDNNVPNNYVPQDINKLGWSWKDRRYLWFIRNFKVELVEETFRIVRLSTNKQIQWVCREQIYPNTTSVYKKLLPGMHLNLFMDEEHDQETWSIAEYDSSRDKEFQLFSDYIPSENTPIRKIIMKSILSGKYEIDLKHTSGRKVKLNIEVLPLPLEEE